MLERHRRGGRQRERRRRAAVRRGLWKPDVLPPDEAAFGSGARAYRCITTADVDFGEVRKPSFRR
jgi:hypothetical protein